MARYVARVNSTWTAQQAFDYVGDFATVQQWDPGVRRAHRESGEPASTGAVYRVTMYLPGEDLLYKVLDSVTPTADTPGMVALEARTRWFTSYDVITISPTATGCTVEYDAQLRLNGPLGLADPGVWLFFQVIGRGAERGLRTTLTGPVVST